MSINFSAEPYPLPRKQVWLPPRSQVGGDTLALRGRGWGTQYRRGTESLLLYVYYNPSLRAKRISMFTLYGEVTILHVFAVEMSVS